MEFMKIKSLCLINPPQTHMGPGGPAVFYSLKKSEKIEKSRFGSIEKKGCTIIVIEW